MSSDEKQKSLAGHRLDQAAESLEEARYLMDGGKSLRSVANRIYYGMFYAVLALLIYEPYSSSKHTGVLSYFNRNFVKSGCLPAILKTSIFVDKQDFMW
ncbi:MAG: HEPN domain-containing protein [Deltaproteobacteria bacterium]|nr:HEPN domain-containing protein [Deltaproteobacteria bacterium]